MALDTQGREKPVYKEGQRVSFILDNEKERLRGLGLIRGQAVKHIIDIWIVEVTQVTEGSIDKTMYPWSCIAIPHSFLTAVV